MWDKTSAAMEKHLDKVEESGNLYQVLDYLANSKYGYAMTEMCKNCGRPAGTGLSVSLALPASAAALWARP